MLVQLLVWLLVLEALSLLAFSFAYRVFASLPDRGWAFSKPLGLLLIGLATWLIGLSHTVPNSRWTVLAAVLALGFLAYAASRHLLPEAWAFLKRHLGLLLAADAVFAAAFIAIALVRAAVPDIVHTEQPMDFMFLNAVVTSPHYPPNDPWLAGQTVSYYYFGYLLIGAVAMLTGMGTAVAYNLGLATVAAMGAVSAFGLTFNLIRLARGNPDAAVLGGFASVFLLLAASNLGGVLELARAAGAGDAAFWEAVGIEGLTAGDPSTRWTPDDAGWWWWRISRIIPGTINEFPFFSFLLGDMHPHVMSIGFVLLTAGVAMQVYLQPGLLSREGIARHWPLAVTSIATVGAAAPLNLWDLPLTLGLMVSAVFLNAARNERYLLAGTAVAITERMVAAGAPGDNRGTGAVMVYRKRGRSWRHTAVLRPAPAHPGARLGAAVVVDETTVIAGAPGDDAVYVFSVRDGVWAQRTVIRPPDGSSNGRIGFGRSLALGEGVLAVGAPDAPGGGRVYMFAGAEGQWRLQAELRDEEVPPDGRFGSAIALSGGRLAVCAPGDRAAYVFSRERGKWVRQARLVPDPSTPAVDFGKGIATGGSYVAVGAAGAAFVFRLADDGTWDRGRIVLPPDSKPIHSFGCAVAVNDLLLVVGAKGDDERGHGAGTAFAYRREENAWRFQTRLVGEDVSADNYFGQSIALWRTQAAVGAPGSGHGAAYVFNHSMDKWSQEAKLVSRWRFGRALLTAMLGTLAALVLASPFLVGFESNATGVLPLRGLQTRPAHLILVWGLFALLILPSFVIVLRRIFGQGNWSTLKLGVAGFMAFAPVILWLQPIWGIPFYLTAFLLNGTIIFLFGLHRAGYRLPRVDEMSFAVNSGVTRVIGTSLLVALLLWDGIINGERGVEGQYLALDRLLIVTPMAIIVTLAIFGAWTLAHRDSERQRLATYARRADRPRNDAFVPFFLMLAFATALIMGVELFHVTDFFGGPLRRMNTVFKAYYQAWLLLSVLGGFGLWYFSRRFHMHGLPMRMATVTWIAVLIMAFAAVSYYPLAALSSRTAGSTTLSLDGQAFLARISPAEYEAIQWIRRNIPRDSVVLESVVIPCAGSTGGCSDYTEAGRISASTGRPTVLGWEQHEYQWRSDSTDIARRKDDVRIIYETQDPDAAYSLLEDYGVDYVLVGRRERMAYGTGGLAKFAELGTAVFRAGSGADEFIIYRIDSGGAAS